LIENKLSKNECAGILAGAGEVAEHKTSLELQMFKFR
jgi:hypothetical protein